jgi:hypothetical protein
MIARPTAGDGWRRVYPTSSADPPRGSVAPHEPREPSGSAVFDQLASAVTVDPVSAVPFS